MAVRLLQAGFDDVTLFERADRVGGVWEANTYPGAACDIPAPLYSFSFAPNPGWSRRYPPQSEIREYLERTAQRFGVLPLIRFGTEVTDARWDDAAGRWELRLGDGGTHTSDVLVTACGQLTRPSIPPVPGREEFTGTAFHSAHWRHDHDLTGRRVAVVGTGASAIQFVPHVVRSAARTTVFQREAPHVIPKPDREYGPRMQTAFRRVPGLMRLDRALTYARLEVRALGFTRRPELLDVAREQTVEAPERSVPDPELRRALTPQHPPGCKRILLSDDYFRALAQPSAELVTSPITRILPAAVLTADGRELTEAWRDGAEAYLGISVAGFPNLFLLYGPNTNLGHNSIVYMIESQIRFVLGALRHLARAGAAVDVRPEVQQRFSDWVQQRIRATVWDRGCSSWYRTASGRNTTNWPDFTLAYRLRTWRFDPVAYREPDGRVVGETSGAVA
jgi:cation diffusion facilitator CzcD-associated flavoprotein CzcO